jgi:multiple sugar transport system substrate-binding protein
MKKAALVGALGVIGMSVALAQGYTGPKVEITYLNGFTGGDRPVMEQMVKTFNDSHPNIVVKATATPWGGIFDNLETQVKAGRAADVIAANEDVISRFAARGLLTPISPQQFTASGINRKDFYAPLFSTADYKNVSYGVPMNSVAYVMFYNRDLMAKNGITAVPKTGAELLTAARRCTTDNTGKRPNETGFNGANLASWGISLYNNWVGARMAYSAILSSGGRMVDKDQNAAFNSPEAVEAVQFLIDLVQKEKVARANATEEAELAAFQQGKVCFFPVGQWYLDTFEKNPNLKFGVAFVPRIGSKDATWGGSSHLVLPRQRTGYDANKRAAALEFMRWMTLPAQQVTWSSAGSLPFGPTAAKDKKFENAAIAGIFDRVGAVTPMSGFPWIGRVWGAFDAAWERAYLGKQAVKASLDAGVAEANKNIAQDRKEYVR